MRGLPKETIVMEVDEAKEYVESKLFILHNAREEVLAELNNIDAQIEAEQYKLDMLNNQPSRQDLPCPTQRINVIDPEILKELKDILLK